MSKRKHVLEHELHIARDALGWVMQERDEARAKVVELRDALTALEKAVNESVSGVQKLDVPAWAKLLASVQAALDE